MTAFEFFILCMATEALVQLIFHGAPVQPFRRLIQRATPFLRSEEEGHLLDCPYCTSVWVGFALVALWYYRPVVIFVFAALAVHRLSNLVHLGLSYVRDLQLDLRIARAQRRG